MSDPDQCARLFDRAFAARAPHLGIEPETAGHRAWLCTLMIACSPLASMLPQAMLDMQFDGQERGFRLAWPDATRRVVRRDGQPVGRIIVDWQDDETSHGVDIAVHPDHRCSGAALAMLRAWLAVADACGRRCTLDVIADNPAMRIYRRLGFVDRTDDPAAPYRFMVRPPPDRGPACR